MVTWFTTHNAHIRVGITPFRRVDFDIRAEHAAAQSPGRAQSIFQGGTQVQGAAALVYRAAAHGASAAQAPSERIWGSVWNEFSSVRGPLLPGEIFVFSIPVFVEKRRSERGGKRHNILLSFRRDGQAVRPDHRGELRQHNRGRVFIVVDQAVVIWPSVSQRASQVWASFHRKTWPLISRLFLSMPAMAAISSSVSGSATTALSVLRY